jgi:hypothetical protein
MQQSYAAHKTRRRAGFRRDGCYGQIHGPETLIACVAPPGDTSEGGTVRFALPLPVASIIGVPLISARRERSGRTGRDCDRSYRAQQCQCARIVSPVARLRQPRARSRGGPPYKRLTSTRTQGDRPARHSAFWGSRRTAANGCSCKQRLWELQLVDAFQKVQSQWISVRNCRINNLPQPANR